MEWLKVVLQPFDGSRSFTDTASLCSTFLSKKTNKEKLAFIHWRTTFFLSSNTCNWKFLTYLDMENIFKIENIGGNTKRSKRSDLRIDCIRKGKLRHQQRKDLQSKGQEKKLMWTVLNSNFQLPLGFLTTRITSRVEILGKIFISSRHRLLRIISIGGWGIVGAAFYLQKNTDFVLIPGGSFF